MNPADPVAAPTWPAPFASSPIDATVRVPGSKSLTNRYLVLAAIADGPSVLRHPLHSRDSALMIAALEALGARIERVEGTGVYGPDLRVTPLAPAGPDAADAPLVDIDCGLAGTVMRFVPPIAALAGRPARFDGDPHARTRPMDTVIDALRQLGFAVHDDGLAALPFTVTSGPAAPRSESPAHVRIDAGMSSQFVSALLLVGCRVPGGLVVEHVGQTIPSLDHINMTIDVLRDVGVDVLTTSKTSWKVDEGTVRAFDTLIEQDLSNAGPFLAAAMVTGGTVRIPDWPTPTTQVGDLWREILPRMGGRVQLTEGTLTVSGPDQIRGIDLADASELAPTVAALCAVAADESRLTGIAHLRGHETNRLAALVTEITRLGGDAEEIDDGIVVRPRPLHAGVVDSYADHRMATFGAVLGLAVDGVRVEDIGTTDKTMPEFPALWERMVDSAGGS
ncbi:3-phosphoshikimate 1-carboxyvinyltransferase [Zhihengliuella salsuginis]|uniref:3-phosphoshikimate 1-carboxyvinyltransferase n=1 Tax=Zhihengliuella salsuginis TaxID=578222 RepID=A0ABQ3GID7_9MICC|nr:3-phosphoshikimate 1-carboxyvinyltransferase [Zhihengliuella salsuginis]GHD08725.1 3-phosphoshikimate 1-carboxyvinyltransferase 1 [Zhihengliuella salsuginis]